MIFIRNNAPEVGSGADRTWETGKHNELTECFDRLLEIARTNPPFANQIQAGVNIEIMGLILKHRLRASHNERGWWSGRSAFTRKNWTKDIDFVALAARSGVSSRHSHRLFRQATGLVPQQYLLNLRSMKPSGRRGRRRFPKFHTK